MIVLRNNSSFDKNSMETLMSTSVQYFISGIKSKATEKNYLYALEQFREHFKIRDYDNLLKIEPENVKKMIEDLVVYDKNRGLGYASINTKICALRLFYEMNDIEINVRRAKKMLPPQKKKQGGKPYSTEMLQELLNCLDGKYSLPLRSAVLIMASSGCRVGFIQYLKFKHIGEFEKNGCKSILIYAGDKEEYYSFINPETVNMIEQYTQYRKNNGEIINEDSWVIPQATDHTIPMKLKGLQSRIYQKTAHLDRGEKVGKGCSARNDTLITHGIRKRWNTIAKNTDGVNYNKVEKMYAHSTTHVLDNTYYKPELSDLFEEYEKFSDKLAVTPEAILQAEIARKNRIIEENQAQKDQKLQDQEKRIAELEKVIMRFTKF